MQMIGGAVPAARHVSSILPRRTAFARWRRFQVTRKSMPLTAATATCTASIRAFGGNAPRCISRRTSAATSRPNSRFGMPRNALEATRRRCRTPSAGFRNHRARGEQLEPVATGPPVPRDLLVRRLDDVVARLGDEVADYRRFNVNLGLRHVARILSSSASSSLCRPNEEGLIRTVDDARTWPGARPCG